MKHLHILKLETTSFAYVLHNLMKEKEINLITKHNIVLNKEDAKYKLLKTKQNI